MAGETKRVHATCVVFRGAGIAIRGRPGAGKSDLALRLIAAGGGLDGASRGHAMLIGDDCCIVTRRGNQIYAAPPRELAGRIEVRGLGIVHLAHVSEARIDLVVDLVARNDIERLPDAGANQTDLAGVRLPRLFLCAFDASAIARITLALGARVTGAFTVENGTARPS